MSDVGVFNSLGRDMAIWLAVCLILGCPAAIATGRAVARVWQPFSRAIAYVAMLAGVTDFLCYALFQVPALPIFHIARQLASGNPIDAAVMLVGYAATFAILLAAAAIGWRITRSNQMRAQYPFLQAN